VIHLIKTDQGFGPSQELRGSRTHSVDCLTSKLELTSGLMGDGSAIDQHDHLFPREGCGGLSPGSPSVFLPFERAPEVMKFFIMVHSLNLCLTWYAWFGQVTSRSSSK
jgi:hypothetical protein